MWENDPQEKKTVIIMFDKVTCSSMYIYMHTYWMQCVQGYVVTVCNRFGADTVKDLQAGQAKTDQQDGAKE